MDTYIQNKGITKTFIHTNGQNHVNEIGWEADYDGKMANVAVGVNDDGKVSQYQFQLDNHDLEQLLSIPSVNQSLDQRLARDFRKQRENKPLLVIVKDPETKIKVSEPLKKAYLSSPQSAEQLIVPLSTIRRTRRNRTPTSRRRHKTYRVYKIPKKSSKRSSRRSIR